MDLNEYAKFFNEKTNEFDDFCLLFLTSQSLKIVNAAKKRSPVDTGFLRSSWELSYIDKSKLNYEAKIINSAKYSSYLEYGTEKHMAYNMVTVPINSYNSNLEKNFNSAFNRYMSKKGKS